MRAEKADVVASSTDADLHGQIGTALETSGTGSVDAFSFKGHGFHLLSGIKKPLAGAGKWLHFETAVIV